MGIPMPPVRKFKLPALGLNIDADDFCGFIKDRDTRILGGVPERGIALNQIPRMLWTTLKKKALLRVQ